MLTQWAWNYFTRKRGTRLITDEDTLPGVISQAGADMRASIHQVGTLGVMLLLHAYSLGS